MTLDTKDISLIPYLFQMILDDKNDGIILIGVVADGLSDFNFKIVCIRLYLRKGVKFHPFVDLVYP